MIIRERLVALISGSGSTAEAVGCACLTDPNMYVDMVAVIANHPNAPGLAKAEALGIPTAVVWKKQYPNANAFGDALLNKINEYDPTVVAQLGWLPLTPDNVVAAYNVKDKMIMNLHPGRLPDFGGDGMHGARVTCATIATFWMTGERNQFTQSTIHLVTPIYDKGQILSAVRMNLPYEPRDASYEELLHDPSDLVASTLETKKRLLPIEHLNVISVLKRYALRDIKAVEQPPPTYENGQGGVLFQAKQLAVQLFPKG